MEKEPVVISADEFPEQLKKLRLNKSMTQQDLADKAGVKQQTISAIEKGTLDPSLKILIAIAGILGVALLIKAFSKKGGTSSE